jgi:Ca2+-binding EF-hand superfamily protein
MNLLKSLGDQWDEQDIDVIFERLDARENSRITFEQFKKIMHSPTSMY